MTFLGCIPPNPFDVPLPEAIPLADQPHLLQVRVAAQSIRVILSLLKLHTDWLLISNKICQFWKVI